MTKHPAERESKVVELVDLIHDLGLYFSHADLSRAMRAAGWSEPDIESTAHDWLVVARTASELKEEDK